jgi:hypothetical protein
MLSTPTLPLEDRKFALKKSIALLCEQNGIDVTFMKSRRRTDKVICLLSGARDQVLPLPTTILKGLEQEDVEVISSKPKGNKYLLQLVVTQDRQSRLNVASERRSKFRTLA